MRVAMKRIGTLAILGLLFSVSAPCGARAEEPARPGAASPYRTTEGTLFWRTGADAPLSPAPLLETDVEIVVSGFVVRATVRQEFTNPAPAWAEGVYVFPLPEDAAVDHLTMRVADRTVEGMILEREAARAGYDQARREGKRASLVEQERPNVFTASVANIPPAASITIQIEYQQAVRYDAGQFSLRFPMVVGPRYVQGRALDGPGSGMGSTPDTDQVPDASRITPPVRHPSRGPINPVRLTIELDPGVPLARLEASYHSIRTTQLDDGRYRIELGDGAVPADRDFELIWEPVAGAAPAVVLLAEPEGDEVFALLMVLPPAPPTVESLRVPREVIFVIDVSGSMHGASIDQAKAALRLALARLGLDDTFNVIRFNHRTDGLFAGAEPATPGNLGAADAYVSGLRAEGGTEMLPALERALDGSERSGRLRQVIFLTDGAVGNEAALFQTIGERLGSSRLFTIGIGSAPNSHFMREAARLGRGTFTYIGSPAEVQAKMVALFTKLEAPAMTDVSLDLPPGADAEALPAEIPDLYLGEPVVVALRARMLPPAMMLRARFGPRQWEREIALHEVAAGAGLSQRWGQAKIAALLDQRRVGAPDDLVRHAVMEVAMRHHLVSPYTSLVAVDVTPVRPGDEDLQRHALETNLPQGWDYTAVFGLGQGATAGPLHVALGLTALLLAVTFHATLATMRGRRARGEDGPRS
jgi:Ca-activated chloride channel family protein